MIDYGQCLPGNNANQEDFDWKNDLLRMKGEEVNHTTFYEYLFSNMILKFLFT